jgi:hypothetical protein
MSAGPAASGSGRPFTLRGEYQPSTGPVKGSKILWPHAHHVRRGTEPGAGPLALRPTATLARDLPWLGLAPIEKDGQGWVTLPPKAAQEPAWFPPYRLSRIAGVTEGQQKLCEQPPW